MNPEIALTLDDAVAEVLGLLTGLDMAYDPDLDRYRAVVRQLNRALRANALEQEWGYYSSAEIVGTARCGTQELRLRSTVRPRIINDDAVRLLGPDGQPVAWAYFLPRDALHKYARRGGLWCAVTGNRLIFSRPFSGHESGLEVQVPVMRAPRMFRLPEPAGDGGSVPRVPQEIRDQEVDFEYPDLIVTRAAYFYAQSDPVMQPRVQTLEAQYKDLMYQVMERDSRNTDSPYLNDFFVPVQGGLAPLVEPAHGHPHADERTWV